MLVAKDLAKTLNKNGGIILDTIPLDDVTAFLELKEGYLYTNVIEDQDYQKKFISYHQLTGSTITPVFLKKYFEILEAHKKREGQFDFRLAARAIYGSQPKKKLTSPQFSYLTRMANVVNDMEYPTYNDQVAALFEFDRPSQIKLDSRERMTIYLDFYKYMSDAYQEILNDKLVYDLLKVFKIKLLQYGEYRIPDFKKIDFLVTTATQLRTQKKLV